jgi:ubiquitin-conjugating enzyme E2 G1
LVRRGVKPGAFTLMAGPTTDQGGLLLRRQLMELVKKPHEGFSAGLIDEDNIYKWEIFIIGPPETF